MYTRRQIGESICIWGSDDDELAERPSLEERVRHGIIAFDGIVQEDRRWRGEVAAGRMRYSAFEHGILMADFDRWLKRCPDVDARIRKLEMRGVEVAGAEEFRERRRLANASTRAELEAPPPRPLPSATAGGNDDAGESEIAACAGYWTAEELRPVGRADLELLVVTGIIVHDALDMTIRSWREDLDAGRVRYDPDRALRLEERFLRWLVASRRSRASGSRSTGPLRAGPGAVAFPPGRMLGSARHGRRGCPLHLVLRRRRAGDAPDARGPGAGRDRVLRRHRRERPALAPEPRGRPRPV